MTSALQAEFKKTRSDIETAFNIWERKILEIKELDGHYHMETIEIIPCFDHPYKSRDRSRVGKLVRRPQNSRSTACI